MTDIKDIVASKYHTKRLKSYKKLFEAGAEVRSCGRVKWIDAETGEIWKNPSHCAYIYFKRK